MVQYDQGECELEPETKLEHGNQEIRFAYYSQPAGNQLFSCSSVEFGDGRVTINLDNYVIGGS